MTTKIEQTTITGRIIDPVARHIFPGHIHFKNGIINTVEKDSNVKESHFILPPLIDAHIHIESSMLTPGEFARKAVCHGTGAVVADPHEIANVLGVSGIDLIIQDGKTVPLTFYFGAPSCVPATPFESAGATLNAQTIATLLARDDIYFLGEMMNFPGVIHNDPEVLAKIKQAHLHHKPVDGHAPALTGLDLDQYIKAGISTDHEATTLDEALEKISKGMKILIRNGSSTKDFASLHPIISTHPHEGMFCSDDLHPADLLKGHINLIVKKSLQEGHNILDILQYSCVNPVRHYNLEMGLLQEGDSADFLVVDNLENFTVLCHYAKGIKIAKHNQPLFTTSPVKPLNYFQAQAIQKEDIKIGKQQGKIQTIAVTDGELFTTKTLRTPTISNHNCIADPRRDILKICVLNRYRKRAKPALGFVSGFGLKQGAMASSIAHDSHNIIAVGCNDEDMVEAINEVIRYQGGIAYKGQNELLSLPLPIAGLIGQRSCRNTARTHEHIENKTKENGCLLTAPFMTLSFLALPVIPQLKITDQGLFDVDTFSFTPLFRTT